MRIAVESRKRSHKIIGGRKRPVLVMDLVKSGLGSLINLWLCGFSDVEKAERQGWGTWLPNAETRAYGVGHASARDDGVSIHMVTNTWLETN